MKIKNQYLNEETLTPYGFVKCGVADDLVEWWRHGEYSSIFIHYSGNLSIFITRPYTNVFIDDVVYRLIVDGLVELE